MSNRLVDVRDAVDTATNKYGGFRDVQSVITNTSTVT